MIPAISVLICVLTVHAGADGKITVDPNTSNAAKPAIVQDQDERLNQKVTYQSTDKRLHTVVDEISQATGVPIRCGRDKDDWQVRDLPIVVSARDVPLGKLLHAIAASTHLLLSSTRVEGSRSYRIWRDASREKALRNYFIKRREAYLAKANWEWDAWTAFGKTPDSKLNAEPDKFRGQTGYDYTAVREFSKIVAKLGSDAKTKVFSGQKLVLSAKDASAPYAESVKVMYRRAREAEQENLRQIAAQRPNMVLEELELTEDDLRNASVEIELLTGDRPSLYTRFQCGDWHSSPAVGFPGWWAKDHIKGLPEEPVTPEPPKTDLSGFTAFDPYHPGDTSLMSKKIKVEKPNDKEEPTFADIFAAFSEASGCAIVCEDFASHHKTYDNFNLDSVCSGEKTVASALSSLRICGRIDLYFDEKNSVLIGSDMSWCDRHTRLVREAILTNLKTELNGDGAQLDDMVPVWCLTGQQYMDWIYDSRDFSYDIYTNSNNEEDQPLWKLYDSLSADDKALAKTDSGLPLAKFDASYLGGIFRKVGDAKRSSPSMELATILEMHPELRDKVNEAMLQDHPELASPESDAFENLSMGHVISDVFKRMPELKTMLDISTNPDAIARSVLRVKAIEIEPSRQPVNLGISRNSYYLSVDGEGINLRTSQSRLQFPVFSAKRERKLLEEKLKAEKEKSAQGQ